jgi:Zn-dependent M28 family amino/carboxypeptidase
MGLSILSVQGINFILRMMKRVLIIGLVISGLACVLFGYSYCQNSLRENGTKFKFDGERALLDVQYQVSLGPRTPGSQAYRLTNAWISSSLEESGWKIERQESQYKGQNVRNVIGKWGEGETWIIIGAHYDSRLVADQDPNPEKRYLPVPGANDGASGVAVLLELARIIPERHDFWDKEFNSKRIWLVFFDAEDNGNLPTWDWVLGSGLFVASLVSKPDAVIVVSMIGDADLNIYKEKNSHPDLIEEIWEQAEKLGYEDYFIPQYRYRILDDHVPFIEEGIPAAVLIDFDYDYWHTTEDTSDKVSSESLKIVGEVLLNWLENSIE